MKGGFQIVSILAIFISGCATDYSYQLLQRQDPKAPSCENTFSLQNKDDVVQFLAQRTLPSDTNGQRAIEEVSAEARNRGFKIFDAKRENDQISLLMEQAATSKSNGFRVVLYTGNDNNGVLSLSALGNLPSGVDPNVMRKNMCNLLATAKSATDRTAVPSASAPKNIVMVDTPFNAAAAKAALEPGNAVIHGQACMVLRSGRAKQLVQNNNVYLFPDSPYLQKWVKLLHSLDATKNTLYTDGRLWANALTSKTNDNGEFRFAQLKPGKYYLLSLSGGTIYWSGLRYVGTAENTNYYKEDQWHSNHYVTMDDFVNVTAGENKKFDLTGGDGLFIWGCMGAE